MHTLERSLSIISTALTELDGLAAHSTPASFAAISTALCHVQLGADLLSQEVAVRQMPTLKLVDNRR